MELKLKNILIENSKDDLIQQINSKNNGLLEKVILNPNFMFSLGSDVEYDICGNPNKCETNVFNFIKDKISKGDFRHYPVGGFIFENENFNPIEHWWIYDDRVKDFVEISPILKSKPICYAGIVNKNIQQEIKNSNNVFDVDFFKGGNVYSKYFK